MKKKVLIISLIIFGILMLFGIYIYSNDNLRFKYEYEMYNYVSFSNGKKISVDIDRNNKIKYITGKEILNKLDNEEPTIIYFGYPYCPWCRSVISNLVDIVTENKISNFYYVDVNNVDAGTISKIKIRLDKYLDYNDEGVKTLYVPDVYFIENGDIKFHHVSNIESYKDPFTKMTDERIKELKSIYQSGIDLIK